MTVGNRTELGKVICDVTENPREIALDVLLTLERGEEFSHILIRSVLDKYNYLDERDKAFIKRITEGTLERQIELDYYLNQYSIVAVNKMKTLIRCLMRMSVYQLIYMDNVPDSAVCNEACKLAQKRKFGALKGFVNGVLRQIARNKEQLELPDRETDVMSYMSVRYSMPLWLIRMWSDAYGDVRTENILKGLLEIRPVSLRLRTDMSDGERELLVETMRESGVELRQNARLQYLYSVKNTDNLESLPGFAEGRFIVQDAASAMAVEAADIKAGDFVIDVCAAPGGKSILAAEKTGMSGRVLARDVSETKTSLIEANVVRMGMTNIDVEVHNALESDAELYERADIVIADVPCSGLGVMGKKRDIKYRVTPERIESLRQLQFAIIESSWRYVRVGGVLLYSTCTINPDENEKMVRGILEHFPFVLEEERQFIPGEDDADGFYYARLRRV